jgi:hypothetical protein
MAAWKLALQKANVDTPDSWHWFLGFWLGKTGVNPPVDWQIRLVGLLPMKAMVEDALRRDFAKKTKTLSVGPSGTLIFEPAPLHNTEFGLNAPAGMALTRDTKNSIKIAFPDGNSVRMPAQPIDDARRGKGIFLENFAAAGFKNKCLIYLYDQVGYAGSPLTCVDVPSGKMSWSARGWGSGSEHIAGMSGPWHNDVEMIIGPKCVVIFGAGKTHCYADGFDLETGKAIFHFSTNLWYREERK